MDDGSAPTRVWDLDGNSGSEKEVEAADFVDVDEDEEG